MEIKIILIKLLEKETSLLTMTKGTDFKPKKRPHRDKLGVRTQSNKIDKLYSTIDSKMFILTECFLKSISKPVVIAYRDRIDFFGSWMRDSKPPPSNDIYTKLVNE